MIDNRTLATMIGNHHAESSDNLGRVGPKPRIDQRGWITSDHFTGKGLELIPRT